MSRIASLTVVLQLSVSPDRQIPPSVLRQIEISTGDFGQRLIERAEQPVTDPASLLRWEQDLHASVPRECIDPVTGAMIAAALDDPLIGLKAEGLLSLLPGVRLQNSKQTVTIDLLGGGKVTVTTPYFLDRSSRSRRTNGRRGKQGNGVYPELSVLGIHGVLSASMLDRRVADAHVRSG